MKLVKTSAGSLYIGSKDDVLAILDKTPKVTFDVIWNLAEELAFLVKDEQNHAQTVLIANIGDYDIPDVITFTPQLNVVMETLAAGGSVFIHCNGGCGRTGTALAIIKKLLDHYSHADAMLFTAKACSGPETTEQAQFISRMKFSK